MQSECYESELQTLQQGKIVNYGNCKSFRLYLDECGIIRCKGRFEYSPTMKDINFPILYGTKHFFTNLTLWNIHQKENCPGYSYTLHEIKKHIYFPKLKITLKKIFISVHQKGVSRSCNTVKLRNWTQSKFKNILTKGSRTNWIKGVVILTTRLRI